VTRTHFIHVYETGRKTVASEYRTRNIAIMSSMRYHLLISLRV